VLCLIALPLPRGVNPFAVQSNNNNNNNNNKPCNKAACSVLLQHILLTIFSAYPLYTGFKNGKVAPVLN
jgi:hypothetical protein